MIKCVRMYKRCHWLIYLAGSILCQFYPQRVPAQAGPSRNIQYHTCSTDTSQQYCLYLPAAYHRDSTYPLLLFLDPAARGNLPVEKYQAIADEEAVIIAGSFGSRNFDAAASLRSIPAILSDVQQKMRISRNAVWLCGFSGGSRMAAAYAAAYEGITGVIGCGAGFVNNDVLEAGAAFQTMHKEIPYAGITGDKDMNFEEMNGVAGLLSKRGRKNILLLFDGGHDWPPTLQLLLAVSWLRMQAGLPVAESHKDRKAVILEQYRHYRDAGLLYYAWLFASNLRQVPPLQATGDSLAEACRQARQFSRDEALFETVLEAEQRFMDQFSFLYEQVISSEEIRASNDELWKQKAAEISQLQKDKNPYRQLSGQRLHDICRRLCTEQYSWLMENGKYKQAYSSAYILSFLDEVIVSPDFLMARAAGGMQDKELCQAHLKKAVKKGKLRKERILNDQYLRMVLDDAVLQKLVAD